MSTPEEHIHIKSVRDELDSISRKLRNLASTEVSSGTSTYYKQGDAISVRIIRRRDTEAEPVD